MSGWKFYTADALLKVQGGGSGSGTTIQAYGDTRPADPSVGDQVILTDGEWNLVWDGSDWRPVLDGRLLVDPTPGNSWSWINHNTATLDDARGAIRLDIVPTTSSAGFEARVIAAPTAPYEFVALLDIEIVTVNYLTAGVGFFDTASEAAQKVQLIYADQLYFSGDIISGGTSWLGNLGDSYVGHSLGTPARVWMQIGNDNTDRYWAISFDGLHWAELYRAPKTDWINPEDAVGFFVNPGTTAYNGENLSATLLSWERTI